MQGEPTDLRADAEEDSDDTASMPSSDFASADGVYGWFCGWMVCMDSACKWCVQMVSNDR